MTPINWLCRFRWLLLLHQETENNFKTNMSWYSTFEHWAFIIQRASAHSGWRVWLRAPGWGPPPPSDPFRSPARRRKLHQKRWRPEGKICSSQGIIPYASNSYRTDFSRSFYRLAMRKQRQKALETTQLPCDANMLPFPTITLSLYSLVKTYLCFVLSKYLCVFRGLNYDGLQFFNPRGIMIKQLCNIWSTLICIHVLETFIFQVVSLFDY